MSALDTPNDAASFARGRGSADLSIAEMVRILDVASEVRRQRDMLDQQWNADAARQDLRDKLLATQATTGESLTPEQVDAAIDWYYDKLHRFKHPPKGVGYVLAHLYIRRRTVLAVAIGLLLLAWAANVAFGYVATAEIQRSERIAELKGNIEWIQKNASAPEILRTVDRWQVDFDQLDTAQLEESSPLVIEVTELYAALRQQFGVLVVDWYPERTGSPAQWTPYPEIPADDDACFVTLQIDHPEAQVEITDCRPPCPTAKVNRWYQAVPRTVRDRYSSNDSTYYAYKFPGELTWQVQLESVTGEPIVDGPRMIIE